MARSSRLAPKPKIARLDLTTAAYPIGQIDAPATNIPAAKSAQPPHCRIQKIGRRSAPWIEDGIVLRLRRPRTKRNAAGTSAASNGTGRGLQSLGQGRRASVRGALPAPLFRGRLAPVRPLDARVERAVLGVPVEDAAREFLLGVLEHGAPAVGLDELEGCRGLSLR